MSFPSLANMPGEISICNRQGHKQMARAGRPTGGIPSILNAGDEDHARQRKLLSYAFSERAICLVVVVEERPY